MTRTAVACPEDDGKPPRKPPRPSPAWKISPMSIEKAQTCIRAAELRARSMSFRDIAAELVLSSPAEAKKCAEVGYGLAPGEDLRMARRRAADELDEIRREAWKVVENPGYATTVTGKLVLIPDPETGEEKPQLDKQAVIAALNLLKAVNAEYRKLYGTDAPKRSLSVVTSLEEVNAEIERVRAEIEEGERQTLLDVQGAGDDDPGGPKALPPGRG